MSNQFEPGETGLRSKEMYHTWRAQLWVQLLACLLLAVGAHGQPSAAYLGKMDWRTPFPVERVLLGMTEQQVLKLLGPPRQKLPTPGAPPSGFATTAAPREGYT